MLSSWKYKWDIVGFRLIIYMIELNGSVDLYGFFAVRLDVSGGIFYGIYSAKPTISYCWGHQKRIDKDVKSTSTSQYIWV